MKNMGSFDRIMRIFAAAVLVYLAAAGIVEGGIAIGAWVIAGVFLVTSIIGFCPAYRLIGINSCGRN